MLAGLTPSQYAKHLAGKAVTLAETLIPPATEDGGTSGPRHELPPLFDELVADHLNGEALEFPFRHLDVLRGHQPGVISRDREPPALSLYAGEGRPVTEA